MNCTESHLNKDYGFWGTVLPIQTQSKKLLKNTQKINKKVDQ